MNYNINGKDEFITEIARRARFTKSDVRIIVNVIIDIFMDVVKAGGTISVHEFGKLYLQDLPERRSSKGIKGGILLPAGKRVIFRLGHKIREAWKKTPE